MNGWIALVGLRYRLVWAHARSRQGTLEFRTLEALYLHVSGQRGARLDWV